MKIVKLEDLYVDGNVRVSFDLDDAEVVDIRGSNSEGVNGLIRGVIIFNHGVGMLNRDRWFIGCAYGLRVTFDDGTFTEFTNLTIDGRDGNRDNINATVKQLERLVFGNGEVVEEPESDMPDIF